MEETNERLKPSGWMTLFTTCMSAEGPIAAYVTDNRVSTEAAESSMMNKVIFEDEE